MALIADKIQGSVVFQVFHFLLTGSVFLAEQVGGEKPDEEATHRSSRIAGG
jgi:hypothetical protein